MNTIIRWGLCLGLLLSLVLSGCSSSEEKAQAEYQRIEAIEKAGDLDQALALYDALVKKYPDTKAGRLAGKARVRVLTLKKSQRYLAMQKHVERLRMALAGYESMYGRFPSRVQDLDDGSYFFDSQYLAETVPADGKIYILLAGGEGTRFWLTQQGDDAGYEAGMQGRLQIVSPAEVDAQIDKEYRLVEDMGNLIIVAPK